MDEIFKALIIALIGFLGVLARNLLAPLITELVQKVKRETEKHNLQISQSELDTVKQVLMPLIESAYRLKLQGKIEDAKERVLTMAREELSRIGIDLSDDMLDEMRRACLTELEMTLTTIKEDVATEE